MTKLLAHGWSVDEALFGSMTKMVDRKVVVFSHGL
jgi:hypothetical protein